MVKRSVRSRKKRLFLCLTAGVCISSLVLVGCGEETQNGETSLLTGNDGTEDETSVEDEEADESTDESGVAETDILDWTGDYAEKETLIAVSVPFSEDTWDYELSQSALSALTEISTDQVGYVLYTASSAEEQADQLTELLDENVDAVVIDPIDSQELYLAAANLEAAGVPIVYFNGSIDGVEASSTVTIDTSALAVQAAASVLESVQDGMEVLVFANDSDSDSLEIVNDFESALSSAVSSTRISVNSDDSSEVSEAFTEWMDSNADEMSSVGAIFAPDADMLLAVLEELSTFEETDEDDEEEEDPTEDEGINTAEMTEETEETQEDTFSNLKLITGCGSSSELLTWVESNEDYPVSVYFYPSDSIHTAIDLAVELSEGGTVQKTVSVDYVEADASNAADYIQ